MELDMLEEIRVDVCVRGQHIYNDIWHAVVGEFLVREREPNNFQDRYAVAVSRKLLKLRYNETGATAWVAKGVGRGGGQLPSLF